VTVIEAGLLLGAFALTCAHFYSEPMRWKIAYLGGDIAWGKARDLFFATALASYLLPFKLGLPLRLVLAVRVTGLTVAALTAIMAVDAMIMLVAWSGVTLLFGWHQVKNLLSPLDPVTLLVIVLVGAVIAILVAFFSKKFQRALLAFLGVIKHKPSRMGIAIAATAVDVLGYGLRHVLIAVAFGLDPLVWSSWAAMGIVATFAGIVSGMPMGLLGYDATLTLLFTTLGASPVQIALVLVCNRGMSLAAAAVLGFPAAHRLGLGGGIISLWRRFKEIAGGR